MRAAVCRGCCLPSPRCPLLRRPPIAGPRAGLVRRRHPLPRSPPPAPPCAARGPLRQGRPPGAVRALPPGQQDAGVVLLSQELAAALLACALFCIFPTADRSEARLPTINFDCLFASATSVIPAVEVEPPGCSFNPPFEAHQDSLALVVADEMRKIYTKELGPKLVPLTVPGEAIAEEDKFFLHADDGDEDAAEGDGDQDTDALAGQRMSLLVKVELPPDRNLQDSVKVEL